MLLFEILNFGETLILEICEMLLPIVVEFFKFLIANLNILG